MNLPLPQHTHASHEYEPLHTSAALQAYSQQCRELALEEAAIDAERYGHLWSGAPAKAFFELAEQIRSLK